MAVTDSQPVSTGNLSALLLSMEQGMDGFLDSYICAGLAANGINQSAEPVLHNVTVDGGSFTLPSGTYIMSVYGGEARISDGPILLPGDYVIPGGTYIISKTDSQLTSISIVKLCNAGGGQLLADIARALGGEA